MFLRKKNIQKKKKTLLYSTVEFILLLLVVFLIRTFIFGLYQVPTGSMETTMLVGERFFAEKVSYWFVRKPERGEIIAFNDPTFAYSKNPLVRIFQEHVWGASNWTKRVIGVPGDHIKGVIENGKPVIYRNGELLSEPYVNKYPLIHRWKSDPEKLKEKEYKKLVKEGIDVLSYGDRVNQYINHQVARYGDWRSYDPLSPFDKQPFYKIDARYVGRENDGSLQLKLPYEPVDNQSVSSSKSAAGRVWGNGDEFDVVLRENEFWCMGDNRRGSWDCRAFGPISLRLIHGRIVFRIASIDSNDPWLIFDIIQNPIEFWSRIRWSRWLQLVR